MPCSDFVWCEWKAGGCLSLERHAPSFSSLTVTPTVGMLQWNRERRERERERICYKETMRSQTRYEWGKWKRKEVDELRVIEGKGQSVIKTHGKWRQNRVRREGKVIDCLVSPHAPVTELIGVAKTKRREVSVTSEPFRRAVRVRLRWDVPFSTSSLLAMQQRCEEDVKKRKIFFWRNSDLVLCTTRRRALLFSSFFCYFTHQAFSSCVIL